ncbi:hypothetical protein [Candidatus Pelagibacter sp.]|uniref:hypothetical protein n=1 Tax=Candidatus Pelagibacter sp. TaxID=2024849 RepID=UPI003F8458E0
MLPKIFKPNNEYELIRIGSNNDGGYLVEKKSLFETEYLISFGLGLNWSFEKHFYNLNKCPIDCYDHTIKYSLLKKFSRKNIFYLLKLENILNPNLLKERLENLFIHQDYKKFFIDKKRHIRSAIGIGTNKTNLSEIIKNINSSNIFFKIDIEGSEYRILDEIINYQNLISGLVIEFHDIDIHREKIVNFIKNFKLNVCHIHGQNPGGEDYLDKNKDPIQIEMTFTRSTAIKSNKPRIPHILDQPADERFPDVKLNFED